MRAVNIREFEKIVLWVAVAIVLFTSGSAGADGNICNDAGLTGKGLGLCTAYCEAMDCDSQNPNANETACTEVQTKFLAETGLSSLPCGSGTGEPPAPDLPCPCNFDSNALRDLYSDLNTYPYQRCTNWRVLSSLRTSEAIQLESFSALEPGTPPSHYISLAAQSFDVPRSFYCVAEDLWTGTSEWPFGEVSLLDTFIGEPSVLHESLYQACGKSIEEIVSEFFPGLECLDSTIFEVFAVVAPQQGCSPLTVQFGFTGVFGGEPPFSAIWQFGDGAESTDLNPTHTYTAQGPHNVQYHVELRLTDSNGYIGYGYESVTLLPEGTPECQ